MNTLIDQSVLENVKAAHSVRKLEKFMDFKDNEFTTDYHYGGKAAISNRPEFKDKIFIVEKKIKFKGRAVSSRTYVISMYDEAGAFVKEMKPEEYDYEFLKTLIYVE